MLIIPCQAEGAATNTTDVLGRPLGGSGKVLFHEHLQFGWPGFALDYRARQTTDPAVAIAALQELAGNGYGAFVDVTTIECGRDLGLLGTVAAATSLQIVAAAGIYEQRRGFPTHLASLSVEELVDLHLHDITEGDAGGRAGVLKVATRHPPLAQREQKAVEAAGIVSARLDIPVITHTDSIATAREQLRILLAAGADPSRIVLGHLDSVADEPEAIADLAQQGVFVGIDRFGHGGPRQDAQRADLIVALRERGVLPSVLISHDTPLTFLGRLSVGDPTQNPYLHIERSVVALLAERGLAAAEIDDLLRRNPWRLLLGATTPQPPNLAEARDNA